MSESCDRRNFKLSRKTAGLLLIDVQEKLIKEIDRAADILVKMQVALKGFQILQLPIVVTEQYPKGLGETVPGLKSVLGEGQSYISKTAFSCLGSPETRQSILTAPCSQWVLVGIEAHVCVLQTAKDLAAASKQVVVLNDAISSRSVYDFSTAIAEMRDIGVRVSSTETILFELLEDSKSPEFKKISQLVK